MDLIKDFFKSRRVGFYLTVAAVLLAIIQVSIYSAAFSVTAFIRYKHWSVMLLSSLAIVIGLGLCVTRWTENFAPLAVFLFELLSFLMFVKYGYMYFTELFFAGVSADAFSSMYYGFMASFILYFLTFGLSIAAFFTRQSTKTMKKQTIAKESAETA